MRKPIFTLVALFAILLASCTTTAPATIEGMLRPGNKIGEMTLEGSSRIYNPTIDPTRSLWSLCLQPEEITEPGTRTTDCRVAPLSWVFFEIGWYAEAPRLAANWDAMEWELYVDGNQVDLDSFDWYEADDPHSETAKARTWFVALTNPTPGDHTIRYLWTSATAIDDGFKVFQPGTYEFILNFTVVKQ